MRKANSPAGTGRAAGPSPVVQTAGSTPQYTPKPNGRQSVPIFVGNKVVGIARDGVLWRRARGSVHMLRQPRAWAIDCEAFAAAQRAGAQRMVVTDVETGVSYEVDFVMFRRYALTIDRGHGRQLALPVQYWRVTRTGETAPVQPELFTV